MSNAFIRIKEAIAGAATKLIDNELFTGTPAGDVNRQRVQIGGSAYGEIAEIKAAAPSSGANGVVVRPLQQDVLDALTALLAELGQKTEPANQQHAIVDSSALPTGAATLAAQTTGNASLASLDGKVTAVNTGAVTVAASALPSGASTSAKQDTAQTSLTSIDGKITAVNTGAVVVSSSALPTGAATAANQTTASSSLASIDGKITACNTGAVTISAALPTGTNTIGSVKLTNGTNILGVDSNLNAQTIEYQAPQAEDNANSVLAIMWRALSSATYCPSLTKINGSATKANIKASAGNLFGIWINNANASLRYLLLHNKATAPVATDVPLFAIPLPTGGPHLITAGVLSLAGIRFTTGIGWAVSTTPDAFTDSATASEHVGGVVWL